MRQDQARHKPGEVQRLSQAAADCLDAGRLDDAEVLLRQILEIEPCRGDILHVLGVISIEKGDCEAGVETIERAIAVSPSVAPYHADLGLALLKLGQLDAAIAALRLALELDPHFTSAKRNLALAQSQKYIDLALRHKEKWELNQASTFALSAISLRPDDALAHRLAGAISFELGEYVRSANLHETALALEPDCGEGYRLLGEALSRQAAFDRAQAAFQKAVQLDPSDVAAWSGLGALLLRCGKGEEADACFEQVRQATGKSSHSMISQRPFSRIAELERKNIPVVKIDVGERHSLNGVVLRDLGLGMEHLVEKLADLDAFMEAVPENARQLLEALRQCAKGDRSGARDGLYRWAREASPNSRLTIFQCENGDYRLELAFHQAPVYADDGIGNVDVLWEISYRVDNRRLVEAAVSAIRKINDSALLQRVEDYCSCSSIAPAAENNVHKADQRKACILIGTCIGDGLAYLLNLSEEFARNFRVQTYTTNRYHKFLLDFDIADEEFEASGLVLHVEPSWADWGNQDGYPQLLGRFASSIPRISFPYPVFHALWPFHCHDPRNDGRDDALFPYGDSKLLQMLKNQLPVDDIIERYTALDVPGMIDLDGLLEKSQEIQMEKEKITDVKAAEFAYEHFRERRVFITVNHVANETLIHMANQVLRMLGFAPLGNDVRESLFELLGPHIPVHPSIIRYFGLKYLSPQSRYPYGGFRNLTFAEYTHQYLMYK